MRGEHGKRKVTRGEREERGGEGKRRGQREGGGCDRYREGAWETETGGVTAWREDYVGWHGGGVPPGGACEVEAAVTADGTGLLVGQYRTQSAEQRLGRCTVYTALHWERGSKIDSEMGRQSQLATGLKVLPDRSHTKAVVDLLGTNCISFHSPRQQQ